MGLADANKKRIINANRAEKKILLRKSLATFWFRVCTCEGGVTRESKPERDSFEMMLNVEKDMGMQKAGRKHCRCGK